MKLKLTTETLQYWQDNPITEYCASLQLSMLEMLSPVSIYKVYKDIAIIKLPKQKTSDDQWYHIVNLTSMLVVGRAKFNDLKLFQDTFDKVFWALSIDDPKRMTLLATLGNVVTTFHCRLQYEYVTDE